LTWSEGEVMLLDMSDGVIRPVQVEFVLSGEVEEAEQTLEAKVKNSNHPSKDNTSKIVTYVFSLLLK
jgi:hypothetical protein